ncbi:hypothetical protein KL86DPRO_20627 [uncultured delta proteobacterium]|uniref:Uncharacterized protein n=1 Tax=uncultured delta proteobacterium TaxID=34034 RepID=A0A212K3K6_9DELT|nr:hypothetical protein KL86DPRO_20627 [uncultured delta proteobacterium]
MAPESTSVSTVSNQTIQIAKPAAGETLNITSVPGGNLAFSFDPAAATITRTGNDLMVEVDGGGTVRLNDFFVVGDQSLPSLTMPDGVSVASADFLSSFNIELETAAGPGAGAGAAGSGAGEYADDAGSLVDGVDRLGSLGTDYWGYESEIPEQYEGLLADAGIGLPGDPGIPGIPGVPPYVPPVDDGFLHAHPNAENVTLQTGYAKTQTGTRTIEDGGTFDLNLDTNITGKTGTHHSGQTKQDHYGITSSSGNYGVLEKALGGFDLKSLIENEDDSWKSKGSSVGAAESGVIKLDASGDLTADWTMVPNNSGSVDGKVSDASIVFLFRINSDGTRTLIDHSDLFRYDDAVGKNYVIKDCSFTWDNLEPGNYVLVYAVAEAGQGNGQKTILCPGEASYTGELEIPVYKDVYNFDLSAEGNVILDPNTDLNADPDHVQDHHSSYGPEDISVIGITCDYFSKVEILDGEFVATGIYKDYNFTFTMTPEGVYTFHIDGKGMAVTLDEFNIQYTIQTPDGKEATSELALHSDYTVIDLSDTGSVADANYDANNIIYGTEGDDIIYGGGGNDILYGGQGADTFAWKAGDHDGSTDKVMDFSFSDGDKLLFEGLTDPGSIDLKLENNVLTLTVPNAAGNNVIVEVSFQAGELEQFTSNYATQNSGDTSGMEQAMLQQMIQNIGG